MHSLKRSQPNLSVGNSVTLALVGATYLGGRNRRSS